MITMNQVKLISLTWKEYDKAGYTVKNTCMEIIENVLIVCLSLAYISRSWLHQWSIIITLFTHWPFQCLTAIISNIKISFSLLKVCTILQCIPRTVCSISTCVTCVVRTSVPTVHSSMWAWSSKQASRLSLSSLDLCYKDTFYGTLSRGPIEVCDWTLHPSTLPCYCVIPLISKST